VGRGYRNNRLGIGGNADYDPDPGFLDPGHDADPGTFKGFP